MGVDIIGPDIDHGPHGGGETWVGQRCGINIAGTDPVTRPSATRGLGRSARGRGGVVALICAPLV